MPRAPQVATAPSLVPRAPDAGSWRQKSCASSSPRRSKVRSVATAAREDRSTDTCEDSEDGEGDFEDLSRPGTAESSVSSSPRDECQAQSSPIYSTEIAGMHSPTKPSVRRSQRFSSSFAAGMFRDTRLEAASRQQALEASHLQRQRDKFEAQVQRHSSFHRRMVREISIIQRRKARIENRERRRIQFQQQSAAAVKLQSLWRGSLGRKVAQGRRQAREKALQVKSSVPLQSACRGWLVRRRLRTQDRAATMIQRAWRKARSVRKDREVIFRLLVKFQARCRGRLIRKLMHEDYDDDDDDDGDDDDDDGNDMDDDEGNSNGLGSKPAGVPAAIPESAQSEVPLLDVGATSSRLGQRGVWNRKRSASSRSSSFTRKQRSFGASKNKSGSSKSLARNQQRGFSSNGSGSSKRSQASLASPKKKARSNGQQPGSGNTKKRYRNKAVTEARKRKERRKAAALDLQRAYRGYRSRKGYQIAQSPTSDPGSGPDYSNEGSNAGQSDGYLLASLR